MEILAKLHGIPDLMLKASIFYENGKSNITIAITINDNSTFGLTTQVLTLGYLTLP